MRVKRSSCEESGDDGSESSWARDRFWDCSRHICSESTHAMAALHKTSVECRNYVHANRLGYSRNEAALEDEQFRGDMID